MKRIGFYCHVTYLEIDYIEGGHLCPFVSESTISHGIESPGGSTKIRREILKIATDERIDLWMNKEYMGINLY